MLKTAVEIRQEIGSRIRVRRVSMKWRQQDAADRAGIPLRTWRRLETEGVASIEDLVKASVALRCEEALSGLFPEPAATSMDQLLSDQIKSQPKSLTDKTRARSRRAV